MIKSTANFILIAAPWPGPLNNYNYNIMIGHFTKLVRHHSAISGCFPTTYMMYLLHCIISPCQITSQVMATLKLTEIREHSYSKTEDGNINYIFY